MNHRLRVINVLVFEALAIFIIMPLFSFIFDKPMSSIGFIAVITSIIAMLINYFFNLYFDKFFKSSGKIHKYKLLVRTILFQVTMLSFFIPFVMFMLDFNFYQSLTYNISGSLFFMLYFYIYNYLFERIVNKLKLS